MRSCLVLLILSSIPLAACNWGFETQADAGSVIDDDGGTVFDGGDDPGSADADLSVCETSELTYAAFASAFMDTYCNDCHSSSLNPGQRRGAPVGVDFDTYELIVERADRVLIRTSISQNMPPSNSPQPSNLEREQLAEWINCGLAE